MNDRKGGREKTKAEFRGILCNGQWPGMEFKADRAGGCVDKWIETQTKQASLVVVLGQSSKVRTVTRVREQS